MKIDVAHEVGDFPAGVENAAGLRELHLVQALESNDRVVLDFHEVKSCAQSWMNALFVPVILEQGSAVLSEIAFKNCNSLIRKMVRLAVAEAHFRISEAA